MRGVAVRVLAGLFAASWLVLPGFGAIDLSVTWNADWPQVLEAGWGLFSTVLVGAAFVLVALRPRDSTPAIVQLVAATAALAISAVVAQETELIALVSLLAIQTYIVDRLRGRASTARAAPSVPRSSRLSRSLLVVAAVGLLPWLTYALHMWELNRENRFDSDITMGIDHYSVQGALALCLAVLPILAASRREARPFMPVCVSAAAFYLGLVSFAWPSSPAGLDRGWSAAAMGWAVALLAVTFARHRADRETTLPPRILTMSTTGSTDSRPRPCQSPATAQPSPGATERDRPEGSPTRLPVNGRSAKRGRL
jgi:hypothetical protein